MDSDLTIARSISLRPITDLAEAAGLPAESLTSHGPWKAKVDHRLGADLRDDAVYVLVSAITPTPAGEGKTVQTIGLSLALNRLGHHATCAIRQPSMGPVFGIKGGAAGGGRSQVLPMEDINLHLTGDFHAIAAANNLLAAATDTSILLDNPLQIDPERVHWKRVLDMNDRALRQIRSGLGGSRNGVPRDTGFEITAASEVMAILGLSLDLADMRRRLGAIVVGDNFNGGAVTAEDLGVAGAMAAILKDALDPTILQTTEGTLAFVHTGPFANIAHGNSSIIADRVAHRYFDFVVTEAGFGADMGAEKFFNIKCRASGLRPNVAVLVVTIRALKSHSGHYPMRQGAPLPAEIFEENQEAVEEGCSNLRAQVANLRLHGVPVVVAVNRFATDTEAEIDIARREALEAGAVRTEVSDVHARGGEGGEALARAVVETVEAGDVRLEHPYELSQPIAEKIDALARLVYGAGAVQFAPTALGQIRRLESDGRGDVPICMAKTQYSLSHDAQFKGRPSGFVFPVRDVRLCAGAGFLVAYAGDIMTMPGLGRKPAYKQVDLDANGEIVGLF